MIWVKNQKIKLSKCARYVNLRSFAAFPTKNNKILKKMSLTKRLGQFVYQHEILRILRKAKEGDLEMLKKEWGGTRGKREIYWRKSQIPKKKKKEGVVHN